MVRTHASEPVDKPAAARPWRTLLWLAVGSLLLGTLALRVAPSLIDLLLVVCARARALPRARAAPLCAAGVVAWVALCLPTTPLEIALGWALGWALGVAVAVLGKTLGSLLVFFAARRGCREWAERAVLREYRAAAALRVLVAERPWWALTMLRLAYIPIGVQNVLPAVLPCAPRVFAGVAAGTGAMYAAVWCNIGSRCADLADLRQHYGEGDGGGEAAPPAAGGAERAAALALGLGAVAALALLLFISTRRLERELRRRGGAVGSPDDSEMYQKLLEEAPSTGDDGRRAGDPTAPPSHRGGKPLWLGGAVA